MKKNNKANSKNRNIINKKYYIVEMKQHIDLKIILQQLSIQITL